MSKTGEFHASALTWGESDLRQAPIVRSDPPTLGGWSPLV